ncbi:CHAT domain-containing protein [Nitrosomonas ureae]|uniref:CHAT domain-containing protein n=1 Tax=Nitrosomonas ureae TaxID=44577 RepID=UPI00072049BC|nr:CHAT domain-containing protein [Nitrosomonas ureae]ALQ51796.1 hypothetical protein ATY38_11540 [Nitrosomonas ureae]
MLDCKQLIDVANTSFVNIGSNFELRPGDNSRSFLLLGKNTILTMAEVYDENLDFSGADLVTLSACDTAMGEDNALPRILPHKRIDGKYSDRLSKRLNSGIIKSSDFLPR